MIAILLATVILGSPIVEPVRSFDRLEEAGYTDEVDSLFDALQEDKPWLCGDAVYHLRDKIDETACSTLASSMESAIARADVNCVFSILKLHIELCKAEEVMDEVYNFAKDAYRNHPKNYDRPMALVIMQHVHREKGYDIFEESLDTAFHARSWHTRHGAFRILLDSYSQRLCREDAERIYDAYPEDIGQSFILTRYLHQMRERIDNTTFGCERKAENDKPETDK